MSTATKPATVKSVTFQAVSPVTRIASDDDATNLVIPSQSVQEEMTLTEVKPRARKPRTAKAAPKPAPKPTPKPTVAELEARADQALASASRALADIPALFTELCLAKAWEAQSVSPVDYWATRLSGFSLPRDVRRELVKVMAEKCPDAPVALIVMMTGSSVPTIQRDRAELGVVSEKRSQAQLGKHADDSDSESGESESGESAPKPKAKKRMTLAQLEQAIQDIDDIDDLAELLTVVKSRIKAAMLAGSDDDE